MKYIFSPLFLLFSFLEYNSFSFCGNYPLTGNMAFMWFMMAIMCGECYVEKIRNIKWQ